MAIKKYRATAKGRNEYKELLKHPKGKHDYEIGSIVGYLIRYPNATREDIVADNERSWGSRQRVKSNLAHALRGNYVTFIIRR